MARFRDYVSESMGTSTYFDFMTLFRRVLADKTLMDFKYMVLEGHERQPDSSAELMQRISKLDRAFEQLSRDVSLQEMASSTYQIHADDDHVTFMEFFWVYMTWMMFSSRGMVEPQIVREVLRTYREAIEKGMDPHLVALRTRLKEDPEDETDVGLDLTTLMLTDVDKTLITVWESNNKPPPKEPGVVEMAIH